ncbi:MAG: hypothetical protein ACK40G_13150 [Cytophagaceae bacterium]
MNSRNILLVAVYFLIVTLPAMAQQQQPQFYLDGLGRAIVTNNKLEGSQIDSTTVKKGISGYTLFDLGANVILNNNFKGHAIMRVRNPYGSFFGDRTFFEFRQIQIDGNIGNLVKYQIGDIYLQMTPYTLFNPNPEYFKYESEIHRQRREIIEYENFVVGNMWRLQGVKAGSRFDVTKGIKTLGINAFGVRTNPTNDVLIPDRLMFGSTLSLGILDNLSLDGHFVGFADMVVNTSAVDYKNNIFTGVIKYNFDNEMMRLDLGGETGRSNYNYSRTAGASDSVVSKSDFFFDVNAGVVYKPLKIKLTGNFRDIGPDYTNPGAQSRRINVVQNPLLFPLVNGGFRGQGLYDRFTQENIYNRGLSFVLQPYVHAFNQIFPYGLATPNRRGFSINLASDTSLKVLSADVNFDSYSEIVGEGVEDLRKFSGISGGMAFNVAKLIGIQRNIVLNAGFRRESTNRGGIAPVDYSSMLIDAGLVLEVVRKIDLMAGYKSIHGKGNEYDGTRNEFNQFIGFNGWQEDAKMNVFSVGGRVRFGQMSHFSVNYNMVRNAVGGNTLYGDYNMNQLFFNYTLALK